MMSSSLRTLTDTIYTTLPRCLYPLSNGLFLLEFDQSFSPSKSGKFLVVSYISPSFHISSKNNISKLVVSDHLSWQSHFRRTMPPIRSLLVFVLLYIFALFFLHMRFSAFYVGTKIWLPLCIFNIFQLMVHVSHPFGFNYADNYLLLYVKAIRLRLICCCRF